MTTTRLRKAFQYLSDDDDDSTDNALEHMDEEGKYTRLPSRLADLLSLGLMVLQNKNSSSLGLRGKILNATNNTKSPHKFSHDQTVPLSYLLIANLPYPSAGLNDDICAYGIHVSISASKTSWAPRHKLASVYCISP